MASSSLDEIIKECCKACGRYRCMYHLDWLQCRTEGCVSIWDSKVFLGCPMCLEKEGKSVHRPRLKEACCLCGGAVRDGAMAYTDSMPAGTFCELCAIIHKIAFWTVKVQTGRLWTAEEIMAERKRAG
jgi:hypothetical protein